MANTPIQSESLVLVGTGIYKVTLNQNVYVDPDFYDTANYTFTTLGGGSPFTVLETKAVLEGSVPADSNIIYIFVGGGSSGGQYKLVLEGLNATATPEIVDEDVLNGGFELGTGAFSVDDWTYTNTDANFAHPSYSGRRNISTLDMGLGPGNVPLGWAAPTPPYYVALDTYSYILGDPSHSQSINFGASETEHSCKISTGNTLTFDNTLGVLLNYAYDNGSNFPEVKNIVAVKVIGPTTEEIIVHEDGPDPVWVGDIAQDTDKYITFSGPLTGEYTLEFIIKMEKVSGSTPTKFSPAIFMDDVRVRSQPPIEMPEAENTFYFTTGMTVHINNIEILQKDLLELTFSTPVLCGAQIEWRPKTTYRVGDRRINNDDLYMTTVAGVSGTTGGPTGTGSTIEEGTVTWKFLGVARGREFWDLSNYSLEAVDGGNELAIQDVAPNFDGEYKATTTKGYVSVVGGSLGSLYKFTAKDIRAAVSIGGSLVEEDNTFVFRLKETRIDYMKRKLPGKFYDLSNGSKIWSLMLVASKEFTRIGG